ncbi:hypothetical protein NW754_001665 [Fusarium falciforme]|nr:hypothetical protein NW754_001665 [Fusarium falciforme]
MFGRKRVHVAAEAEGLADVVVAAAGNYAVEAAEAAAFVGVVGFGDGVAAVADAPVAAGMLAAAVVVVATVGAAGSGMSAVDADFGVEAADKAAVVAAPVVDVADLAAAVVDLVGDAAGLAADTGLAIDAAVEAAGTDAAAVAEDNGHHPPGLAELRADPAEDTVADAHIDLAELEDIDSVVDEGTAVDLAAVDELAGHST